MQASGWESQAERGMEEGGQEEVSSFLEPLGLRHKRSREGWGGRNQSSHRKPFPSAIFRAMEKRTRQSWPRVFRVWICLSLS